MTLIDLRVAGSTVYSNDILKNAPYKAVDPLTVTDPGLLVKFANQDFTFDLADENGPVDGVTTSGSRDSGNGVWNIAYTGNIDAILVLTDDTTGVQPGKAVYAGVGGKATVVVPAVDSYIIGVAKSGIKTTTLCDGTTANCFEVIFEKVRTPVAAPPAAPISSRKISKEV